MSSKSTIISTVDANIYSDCNEGRYFAGKHLGDDIFMVIDKKSVKNLKIDNLTIKIILTNESELASIIGENISIFGGSIDDFEIDEEDLMITIKGGSFTAKQIQEGKFI